MDDTREAAKSTYESLYILPTNCLIKGFCDDIITDLTKSLALAKVLRAWSLGTTEGIKNNYRNKRMNNYFKLLCTPEEKADDKKTHKKIIHQLSHDISKEIPALSHLINSVSFTHEDARHIDADMVDIMKDKGICTKFELVLRSCEAFKQQAWLIATKEDFETVHCRIAIRYILESWDSKPSDGCKATESTQGQLASKRRYDEKDVPQKRAKTGIRSHPEAPTTENNQECLQEHQTPHIEPPTGSPSVFRGMF
uniref:Uncharacterized protein n=1 Tax=Gibberella zeae TaxID=5518 RepID=A0A4E9ELV5_GIBZA